MGVSYSKISESDDPNILVIENALMPHTRERERESTSKSMKNLLGWWKSYQMIMLSNIQNKTKIFY